MPTKEVTITGIMEWESDEESGPGNGNGEHPPPINPDLIPSHPIVLPPDPPPTVGEKDLVAIVAFQGHEYEFREENAEDLGNFVDPKGRFTQSCFGLMNEELPGYRVMFRRDTTSDRREIVFELGEIFGAKTVVAVAHRVAIFDSNGEVAVEDVPQHPSYCRWRWQSEPRPVTVSIEELQAKGMLPRYDPSMLGSRGNTSKGSHVYEIMGRCGLTPNMWQTGERSDIGPTTGWQADYIIDGSNLETILAQAEAHGSFPICHRDENTWGPIDLIEHPGASSYGNSNSNPRIYQPVYYLDGIKCGWDNGHQPALCWLPYLLTGDPYFLEGAQLEAQADLLMNPAQSRYSFGGRYFGWSLRDMGLATHITPEEVPCWIKPRSYMLALLKNYENAARGWMASSDPTMQLWHLGPSGGSQTSPEYPAGSYCAPWQESFIPYIMSWLVMLGFEEFRDIAIWKGYFDVLRGTEGEQWHRCNPAPYQFAVSPAVILAQAIDVETTVFNVQNPQNFFGIQAPFEVVSTASGEVMTITNMQDAQWTAKRENPKKANSGNVLMAAPYSDVNLACDANFQARPAKWPVMPGDEDGYDLLYTLKNDATYASYLRGSLTMLVLIGHEEARKPLEWLEEEMFAATSGGYGWDRKWTQVVN